MTELTDRLFSYSKGDTYPFHMPGHKRRPFSDGFLSPEQAAFYRALFSVDITEIDGFDNLHHPTGILKSIEEEMQAFYGSEETHILVNGSTVGILASLFACCGIGETVLCARNCHRAVYSAVLMRGLNPVWVYPETGTLGICGGIAPEAVRKAVAENPAAKAFVLTSPTYEGVVSDVAEIAKICHEAGLFLIVDEAHGAHLPFAPEDYPLSAVCCGADLVIQSFHKTLPAMTQTAVYHVMTKKLSLTEPLALFETSSPSYVMMSSVETAFSFMKKEGKERLAALSCRLSRLRKDCGLLSGVKILSNDPALVPDAFGWDPSKLILYGAGVNGAWLMEELRKQGLELEMCLPAYALAMTSVMDEEKGFERLYQALLALSGELLPVEKITWVKQLPRLFSACSPEKAQRSRQKRTALKEAVGSISGETLWLYPPGVPFVVAGEVISEELVALLTNYREKGFTVIGLSDPEGKTLSVAEP